MAKHNGENYENSHINPRNLISNNNLSRDNFVNSSNYQSMQKENLKRYSITCDGEKRKKWNSRNSARRNWLNIFHAEYCRNSSFSILVKNW